MREWFRGAGPLVFGLIISAMPGSVALAASPLDGSQWNIKMTSPSAPAPPDSQIHFKNGKFVAPPFEKQGFPSSNYSLTNPEGAPLVWETMQTSANVGTLSWRGELDGDTTMRGIASWQKADGTVVTYSFVATRIGAAPRAATPKPEAPSVMKPKPEEPGAAKPESEASAAVKPKPEAPSVVKPKPEATSAIKPKVEEPRSTKTKAEEPRTAKPKAKSKPKSKAPVQSKPE
jgi:hypothetical protein